MARTKKGRRSTFSVPGGGRPYPRSDPAPTTTSAAAESNVTTRRNSNPILGGAGPPAKIIVPASAFVTEKKPITNGLGHLSMIREEDSSSSSDVGAAANGGGGGACDQCVRTFPGGSLKPLNRQDPGLKVFGKSELKPAKWFPVEFRWEIKDFLLLTMAVGEPVTIGWGPAGRRMFFLFSCCPNGNVEEHRGWISLFVDNQSRRDVGFDVKIFIVAADGTHVDGLDAEDSDDEVDDDNGIYGHDDGWGIDRVIEIAAVKKEPLKYLHDGALVVVFRLEIEDERFFEQDVRSIAVPKTKQASDDASRDDIKPTSPSIADILGLCSETFVEKMTTENVADVAALACSHSLNELRDSAIDFMTKHWDEVAKTGGWTKLEQEIKDKVMDKVKVGTVGLK